ncbi:MAG: winged helix DNA-binding domain-containing protein, partial [Deltaproteobacteria bacterium]|nr:winged helix DNA-binding domain-containing protein [Deltaproteobacteria bacterium]
MPVKGSYEVTSLRQLQRYHHSTLNTFSDGETLVEAIHKRPGIYGPNPIAYLSLLARRPTLTLGDMEEALINDRSLVRATAFRGSLFLLASEDYPLYFRALFDTLSSTGMSRLRSEGFDEEALKRFGEKLKGASFAMQKSDADIIAILFPGKERRPGVDVERTILRKLCDLGVLVRTTTKGWKGNQFNYALAEQWLPESNL